jgi:hypothetical protein
MGESRMNVRLGQLRRGLRGQRPLWHWSTKKHAAEIIDTLNMEINAAVADPAIKARIVDLGGTIAPGKPNE